MADEATDPEEGEEAPKKKSKMPLIIGLVLAIAGGAGGFFLGSSGILGGGSAPEPAVMDDAALKDTSFVTVDPLIVSIVRPDRVAQLRLILALEVESPYAADVENAMPRLKDVLNSYLRAVDPAEFDGSGALVRLRAQMLRRVQIVIGNDAVHDLLVQEFVVN